VVLTSLPNWPSTFVAVA